MGLLDTLQALGTKLRLIQAAGTKETKTVRKIATRSVTMKELMVEVDRSTVQALAMRASQTCVPLEKVFESAGIKPHPKGWTIDRLMQLLATAEYRTMDRKTVQKKVLVMLAAEGVGVEELVKDALARDQALDAFEVSVAAKMRELASARQGRVSQLEAHREKLMAELARLKEEEGVDAGQLAAWQKSKSEYEKELSWAVGFLTECKSPESSSKGDQKKLV
jgi:hypothetical protein